MTSPLESLVSAVAGRYTVERELGRGGMAIVYLARDERHRRQVALKVIAPETFDDVGAERFRREIEFAANLNHPNIVSVFDSGQARDLFFYVMPYVEGESLAEAARSERPFDITEAVTIVRQVADALDYAHVAGVVHRDIKPSNILLMRPRARGRGGRRIPLVADFGIACAVSADGGRRRAPEQGLPLTPHAEDGIRLTATGRFIGTPAYMSPEQIGGSEQIDGRSDQYSLGCVLYELLAGEAPFTGLSPMAVLARHVREPLPSLRDARPMVPKLLAEAVGRAMAKAPDDRFETMADFSNALADATLAGTAPETRNDNILMRAAEILGRPDTSLDQATRTVLVELADAVGARRGAILIHDNTGRRLAAVAAIGVDPASVQPISLDNSQSVSARVFRTQKPMLTEPDEMTCREEMSYRRGWMLSVPIAWATPSSRPDGILGVVNLSDRRLGLPFSSDDEKLVTAIARQIASAIQTVRLVHSAVQQQRARRDVNEQPRGLGEPRDS